MKIYLRYFIAVFGLMFLNHKIFAQAPNISYSTPVNVYTLGVPITNLVPTNTGGSVSTATFSSTSVSGPSGMGISPSGNLYVTQYGNGKITYYNSSGTYLGIFGAGFTNPDGIAFDSSGNAYIVDTGAGKIYKITTGGVQTTLITGLNGPFGIGIDGSGNIYVTNTNSNQVRKYANTGGPALLTITTNLSSPSDVRVDATGNIYVLNIGSGKVTKYNSAGTYLGIFASGFNSPFAIAISSSGNVYVGDSGNNQVDIYNSSGTLLNTISVTDPEGIVVDAVGDVFVSSYSGNKIYEYPPLGGYVLTGTLPAGLSFNTATGIISGTPTASSAATNYTITAYNGSGSSATTISIACKGLFIWIGNKNSTWTNGLNWQGGSVPGANDTVTIGVSTYTGSKKEPAITTAVTVSSITFGKIGGNHTLTIASPGTLNIGGYLTVPTLVSPTITGTGALNIAPGATLNVNGTGVLTTNLTGKFTLQSDSTGSASVGQILKTSIIGTGADSINVQRYITGGAGYRAYRLLSSPVYSGTAGSDSVYSINYLQDHIFLTGALGTTNGFDKAGNPTLYLFREDQIPAMSFTSGNFVGISKINVTSASHGNYDYYMNGGSTITNIPVGNGVMIYFRGDRTTVNPYLSTTIPISTTLTAIGTLNAGQITLRNWYTPTSGNLGYTGTGTGTNYAARGFNLVGNPYASSIDWETFNTTTTTSGIYGSNIANTIYEWNPATSSYATYMKGGASTNNGSNTIVSGEGFFVLATNTNPVGSNPVLIFNESAKVATQNTGANLFMATKADVALVTNTNPDQHLRLQLALDSIQKDDIYIGFNERASNNYVFNEDASYKAGTGKVSLGSMSNDNVSLAINKLPLPKLNPTAIKLNVGFSANGTYKLNMTEIKGIPELYEIWLMDNYKKDSLDIKHNYTYAFDVNTDTNSYGSNRFKLVIRQNLSLAVHLLNFTATKVTDGAQLVWKTENEQNYTNFTVERSTDNGTTFNVLGGFSSSNLGTYSFVDKKPAALNEYRLKLEDLNGTITYSKIVTLMYSDLKIANNISVYPNPATSFINLTINPNTPNLTSNLLALQTPGTSPGIISKTETPGSPVYDIKIINMNGSIIKTATSSSANWQTSVSNLSPGTYIIQVLNNDNNSLVGKSTFIKL